MTFNSLAFVAFFLVVYGCYIAVSRKVFPRNILLLLASYFFYGWWDWRFLVLIWFSTICDYYISAAMGNIPSISVSKFNQRKLLLLLSLIINLSILAFFKYCDFFIESISKLTTLFHFEADYPTLHIILPLGISFYTFQTLSYTIDVYRKKLTPTKSLLNFSLYVAFFPQLVAGPIERAVRLLPQIETVRTVTAKHIETGLFLILFGFYKKIVVADNMGIVADRIFNNYELFYGVDLLIGIAAFSLQIYCDVSGYSDIARGIARLMGFDLMLNFNLPYFARSPKEFWHRWHISLSTWFRDYLYIPLGGSRGGILGKYRNLVVTMLVCGLWHGAGWNFVLWGLYHGILLVMMNKIDMFHASFASLVPKNIIPLIQWLSTLLLVMVGWVIFRSSSFDQCITILTGVFSGSFTLDQNSWISMLIYILPLVAIELLQYIKRDLLVITKLKSYMIIPVYTYLLAAIFVFGVRTGSEFIYFQF